MIFPNSLSIISFISNATAIYSSMDIIIFYNVVRSAISLIRCLRKIEWKNTKKKTNTQTERTIDKITTESFVNVNIVFFFQPCYCSLLQYISVCLPVYHSVYQSKPTLLQVIVSCLSVWLGCLPPPPLSLSLSFSLSFSISVTLFLFL